MDVILTYDREAVDALDSSKIVALIQRHQNEVVPNLQKNMDYYMGKQAILEKQRDEGAPNEKPVCNHAKNISDLASGYFLGNPITYKLKEDQSGKDDAFDIFQDALDDASTDDDDQENALMLSICGKTYEYIYAEEGEPVLQEKPIDPQNAFIVYDQSIEHKELFGVYYYQKKDDLEAVDGKDEQEWLYVLVMTETLLKYYKLQVGSDDVVPPYREEEHHLGYIPLIEYKNNRFAIGDFEQQIPLIDAYNTMMADRINDMEQFIDAFMVITGAILADEGEEDEATQKLKKERLLQLPIGATAEYLVHQLDESGVEIVRKAFKEDIYTFSEVPNMTDENFAGNSSGVAMEYKLLGLEMLTKTKERWYRRGLRKRVKIFLHYLGIKGVSLEEKDIEFVFTRSLPKNLLELSQIVANLSGIVSNKTLIAQFPFVEDPEAELEAVEQEKKENQEAFGFTVEASSENTPPEVDEDEEA